MSNDSEEQYLARLANLADEVARCKDPKFLSLLELRNRFITAVERYPQATLDAIARAAINLGDIALYIEFIKYSDASETDIIRNVMTEIIARLQSQTGRERTADILEQVIYQVLGAGRGH